MSPRAQFVCLATLALLGCVEPPSAVPNTGGDSGDTEGPDLSDDTALPRDTGAASDIGSTMDVGAPSDLGTPDAAPDTDMGTATDAGSDASVDMMPDMGVDMTPDAAADMGTDAEIDMMPAPTCMDGVLNGDETDVDCGGPACPVCIVGEACIANTDCDTGFCDGGTCSWPASCAQVKRLDPTAADGSYRIDADGTGPAPAVDAHCDMTSDGGVGYTIYRIDDATLGTGAGVQDDYRAACDAVGMEVIVPRTKAHALAISAYNGEPPNLVNIYPLFDGAQGLNTWEGRCQGQPCRFWVNDTNSALCNGFEPNGDNSTTQALYRWYAGTTADCPYGNWNDAPDGPVSLGGWVLCSTNDAGPPTYPSCLEVIDAGSVQNTRYAGTSGGYVIEPSGASAPVEVICDMVTDSGGYTYLKVEEASPTAAVNAEQICATYGMQLFIPRTFNHLVSAFFAATNPILNTTANKDYLSILGIYPQFIGATCAMQAFASTNTACQFRASDDGRFFVTSFNGSIDPDGSTGDTDDSLLYVWNDDGTLALIDDFGSPGATSYRFMCDVGDKQ